MRDRDPQADARWLLGFRDDPCAFAEQVLGVALLDYQAAVLRDLAAHSRVACRAARGVGKTHLAAVACLWFVATRANARCLVTGPQLENSIILNLLPRAHSLLIRSPLLRGMFAVATASITARVELYRRTWGIFGVASETPAYTAGVHHRSLLIVVDESAAVARAVFTTLLGSCTEGEDNRALLLGTPALQPVGFFASVFEGTAA